ncbi:putative low-complexity protein [Candidatus Regiella insecticola 5.15]|uniref:Putative low-complexity protein n=1 Tax=Candidatus Regiella insecticola 5.15 TaxID=1005043 RepID=G2GXY8_9ENTR|nr:pentapeptide repeat-containing protein [Candidatus Regiella insecticola]EGY29393.1 putative low-complexity protein [Candidatus Regiella insecticola 5.15]
MFGFSKKISHELATLRAIPSKNWSYSQIEELRIAKRKALKDMIAERPYDTILDLSKVNLEGVDISGLNLNDIDFGGADLSWANAHGSNLSNTSLKKTTLTSTDLGWTNLNGADLTETSINTAIITGATFIGATIKGTTLPFKINLQGAKIEDQITLSSYQKTSEIGSNLIGPSNWRELNLTSLAIYLNDTGSLLTTIDSIDCDTTKVLRLASQLIESLGDTDVLTVAPSLLSILGKAPYIADTKIAEWLDKLDKISLAYLKQYNEAVMPPLNEADLNFFEGMFSRQPELKFTANAAFIQFVAQAVAMGEDNRVKATALYKSY